MMNLIMVGGAERVETGNRGKSTNLTSRVRLLTLIFVFLTLAPIVLSVYLYYLPLNDIEVKVEETHWGTEAGYDYIALRLNVTNKGSISHIVHFTCRVVFNSQPDKVFTQITRWGEIYPSDWHLLFPPTFVFVPHELFHIPYEASCSVTLIPFVNQFSINWIVLPGVVWLIVLAAVLTSLVRSRRQTR